jgi:glutathione peroxidase
MKPLWKLVLVMALTLPVAGFARKKAAPPPAKIYTFSLKDIDGKEVSLSKYKGKVLLVVNVASLCGNTPQYRGLEALYERYHKRGFDVLGFPCNDFGSQEPSSEAAIKHFCTAKYHVSFPMFSKVKVLGDNAEPLYRYLTRETKFQGDVEWNFAKFVVSRKGKVIARFAPETPPDSKDLKHAIERAFYR